jgi:hypothetical protein
MQASKLTLGTGSSDSTHLFADCVREYTPYVLRCQLATAGIADEAEALDLLEEDAQVQLASWWYYHVLLTCFAGTASCVQLACIVWTNCMTA